MGHRSVIHPHSRASGGHGTGTAMFQKFASICFMAHGPTAYLECHEKITLERPVTRDATMMKGHGSEGLGRPPGRERTSKTTYFYSRSSIARSRCVLMLCEPLSGTRRRVNTPLRPPPSMFTFVRSLRLPRN